MAGEYEIIIGLEVHVQLLTESKMFCGCSTKFGMPPNTQVCPVCLGMPGVLPVINYKAVELAIKAALAFNSKISKFCRFARKNYFYPDLPKNYQISQYEEPLAVGGYIVVDGRKIHLKRIHLEEDAGKLLHPEKGEDYSLIDFNRAGIPLLEIVSEPEIRSPQEAEKYLLTLKQILEYLDISDCNMEEGSLRCDANISVRRKGENKMGTKVEVKNMNSFKGVRRALSYEAKRQIDILENGGEIIQETRLWNENLQITEGMRGKEEAHDYRYFPEPDLLPLTIDDKMIETIKKQIGELPGERKERFCKQYNLSQYDAEILTSKKEIGDYFEKCVKLLNQPKVIANWIMGDLMALLKEKKAKINETKLTPELLTEIISLVINNKITANVGKELLVEVFETGKSPKKIVEEKKLLQIEDDGFIIKVAEQVLEENKKAVEDYKKGKEKVIGFLIGKVMEKTKGKANPQKTQQILKELLKKVT
ncbi:MAG: Asp-tRNA(Asn)/Glu-tRNA(Gln) amidotransferase GatCAB subunit B [Candidatus Omnitrophota bacterium]|nr:MAG: Asp-tRNA(Asn)/Glu-tRNA(Gln) amidotransferase GatCAB subunit B [Candidatus Omnitrophota bacterium]